MSWAVNDAPISLGVYGAPGTGKTARVAAMVPTGTILTPNATNVISLDRVLGIDMADYYEVCQIGSYEELNGWLAANSPWDATRDGPDSPKRVLIVDDLTPMATASLGRAQEMFGNPRDLYGYLKPKISRLADLLSQRLAAGVSVIVTAHEARPGTDEKGRYFRLPATPDRKPDEMPYVQYSYELAAQTHNPPMDRVIKTLLRLEAGSSPVPWWQVSANHYRPGDDSIWFTKDVFDTFGVGYPASLREGFRAAGRDIPPHPGLGEGADQWIAHAAKLFTKQCGLRSAVSGDFAKVATAFAEKFPEPVGSPLSRWILEDGYARHFYQRLKPAKPASSK